MRGGAGTWLRLLRVRQWSKNALVLAAFFFALGDRGQSVTWALGWKALGAMVAFCLVSSAVYIVNDWKDAPQDRLHPRKKDRPIASGAVGVGAALVVAGVLAAAGVGGALAWLGGRTAAVLGGYLALQAAYTAGLKRVPLVDVMVLATGFVMRAYAGGAATGVPISPWLLVCTLFLALFLALCKRRHEKVHLKGAGTRASLDGYDERMLDQLIGISASSSIIVYSIYTLWPDTVAKFGSHRLAATIPFVVFGVFRYLDLTYRQGKGERPEALLTEDGPLIADILLYGAVAGLVIFMR